MNKEEIFVIYLANNHCWDVSVVVYQSGEVCPHDSNIIHINFHNLGKTEKLQVGQVMAHKIKPQKCEP